MSDYKRFVSYLFSYENGIKKDNVGYARIENYREQCKINIHMKDTIKREQKAGVYLFYREDGKIKGIFVKEMEIKNGLGSCKITTNKSNIENSSHSFEEIGGIIVYLASNRFWGTEWDDRPIYGFEPLPRSIAKSEQPLEAEAEPTAEESRKMETPVDLPEMPLPVIEPVMEKKPLPETELDMEAKPEPELEVEEETSLGKQDNPASEKEDEPKPQEAVQAVAAANVETKGSVEWKQQEQRDRFAPYTKIYPFHEQSKECIGIQPKDLGKISPILEQWQNNNFLLHGYGRFRHILLLRRKGNQGEEYFIGVPGMYRPREENLAVTYGFTMFVPMKKEKAEYGDFGYWCTEVKLPETDG